MKAACIVISAFFDHFLIQEKEWAHPPKYLTFYIDLFFGLHRKLTQKHFLLVFRKVRKKRFEEQILSQMF